MKNKDFAHLHVHTTYSQLDGYGLPEEYAKRARRLGFKYLACTDHGNIDALIKFQNACKKYDIVPILGCEAYIVSEWKKDRARGHITIWVKNQRGFKNLCSMLSAANLHGFYYKPRIDFKTFLKHKKGLCVGTACLQSFVNSQNGRKFFNQLHDGIGDDLYCEIMPHDMRHQIRHNRKVIKLAKKTGIKVIATNDCHYIKKSDHRVQEVMLAIQRKTTWNDENRWSFDITGLHLKHANEMKNALRHIGQYKKEYLTNTIEIAEKCGGYTIPKRDIRLPRVPGISRKQSENITLWRLCVRGFRRRFNDKPQNHPEYYKRMKREYRLIRDKNFSRYFLIVWELCEWCRSNGILVGPGRGSVGGSLLAYLLRITSVDPIKHGLIFDRFINEDRIDYPDIDIDFEHAKRHLVKEHLEDLYGENNIAGVSSFNRMQAKAAIQDVARVFEVPGGEVNRFTKMIDDSDGDTSAAKITMAIEDFSECREFANTYKKVIKYAIKLVGQVRTYGQHAAALVVSLKDISKSGRCNLIERDGVHLINWEKDDAEYVGLMKLDVLGVKVLSILSHVVKLVEQNHGKHIDLEKISLEDKTVIGEIARGNNVGVFQLNTWAMTSLIKEMNVSEFSHIVDSLSLVRPGPMQSGMTKEYIKRQKGKRWQKMHPVYEETLKDTYGLVVFQEQVMAVINKVAGLPYSTADKIRKVIGKKRDVKEFAQYRDLFLKGCKKTGYLSPREANHFWEGLQKWARYGFNMAHSVEYAIIGYWCAWLKHYYPTEFICGSLTYGAKDKKKDLIEEAYRLGLTLQLPKVGLSHATEWLAQDNKLLVPFIEVKGIGPAKAIEAAAPPKVQKNKTKLKFVSVANHETPEHKGSLGKLLKSIGAYNPMQDNELPEDLRELFDFRLIANPTKQYANLYTLYGSIRLDRLDDTLQGVTKEVKRISGALHEINNYQVYKSADLPRCNECQLRSQCTAPVSPSPGRLNMMVVGEAPGKEEDAQGKGFVGRSGDKVWKSIGDRKEFHVTNVAKCWPKISRKPSSASIKKCGSLYLHEELRLVKPILVLAFGNTSLEFFTGRKSGIIQMSGQTTWSEEYGCYIAWCLHPAATMHNPDNEQYYIAGIKNFKRLRRALG